MHTYITKKQSAAPSGRAAPAPQATDPLLLQRQQAARVLEKTTAGAALDDIMRQRMEERFGVSMRGLRVHRDPGLRQATGESAYSRGREIHLDPSVDPHGSRGESVLMHEAAHVIQTGTGAARGEGILSDPSLEAQAHSAAAGLGGLDTTGFQMPSGGPMQGVFGFGWLKKLTGPSKKEKAYANGKLQDMKQAEEDRMAFEKQRQDDAKTDIRNRSDTWRTSPVTDDERQASGDSLRTMASAFHNRSDARDDILAELLQEEQTRRGGTMTEEEKKAYSGGSQMRTSLALAQVSGDRNVNKAILKSLVGSGGASSSDLHQNLSDEKMTEISRAFDPIVNEVMGINIDGMDLNDISTLLPHESLLTRYAIGQQGINDLGKKISFGRTPEESQEFQERCSFLNTAYKVLETYHTSRMLSGKDLTTTDVGQEYNTRMESNGTGVSVKADKFLNRSIATTGAQLSLGGGYGRMGERRDFRLDSEKRQADTAKRIQMRTDLAKGKIAPELQMPKAPPKAKPSKSSQPVSGNSDDIEFEEGPTDPVERMMWSVQKAGERSLMQKPKKKSWWQFWK